MINKSFYLSDENDLTRATNLTGLSEDEIEAIVGRFSKISARAGKLRGKVEELLDGRVLIRHHFNKKVLWVNE